MPPKRKQTGDRQTRSSTTQQLQPPKPSAKRARTVNTSTSNQTDANNTSKRSSAIFQLPQDVGQSGIRLQSLDEEVAELSAERREINELKRRLNEKDNQLNEKDDILKQSHELMSEMRLMMSELRSASRSNRKDSNQHHQTQQLQNDTLDDEDITAMNNSRGNNSCHSVIANLPSESRARVANFSSTTVSMFDHVPRKLEQKFLRVISWT